MQYLKVLGALFYWIAGWFAISISVFLRRNFGERYLSWINLYCGYSLMATFAFFGAPVFQLNLMLKNCW
jgi:hypothetical protein